MDAVASQAATTPRPGPCADWPAESIDIIRDVLDQVGDKWSVLAIATLQTGPLRYSDLHRAIPGISQRMLTRTLGQLRRDGLVTRTAYAQVPPRVDYALTPLGTTLLDSVLSLAQWAATHHAEIRQNRTRFDRAETP